MLVTYTNVDTRDIISVEVINQGASSNLWLFNERVLAR